MTEKKSYCWDFKWKTFWLDSLNTQKVLKPSWRDCPTKIETKCFCLFQNSVFVEAWAYVNVWFLGALKIERNNTFLFVVFILHDLLRLQLGFFGEDRSHWGAEGKHTWINSNKTIQEHLMRYETIRNQNKKSVCKFKKLMLILSWAAVWCKIPSD